MTHPHHFHSPHVTGSENAGDLSESTEVSCSRWKEVSAELREYRDAQRRLWGDVDSLTLGRYLSGEVTDEERRTIEAEFQSHPELQRVADLVREVLVETTAPAPNPPIVLPFKQVRQTRPPLSKWGFGPRLRRLGTLAAAACVLLAVGVTLFRSHQAEQAGQSALKRQHLSDQPAQLAMETKRADQSAQMTGPISIGRGGPGVARIDLVNRQVASLEEAGDLDQALKVAQEYRSSVEKTHGSDHHYHVHSLNVLAKLHAKKGNLTQAEEGFRKAWTICRKSCGPDDPQTVEQTIALADVYQTALNTTPQYSTTLKYDAAKDSWFGSTEVQRPFPRFPPAATPHAPPAVGASAASGTFPGGTDREDRRLSVIQLRQKLTRQSPHEVQQTVVPVLQRAIVKTKNDSERLRYIRAVGQIGPAAMDVVPVLIKRLEEATDVDERKMLLQALGRVGPAAEEAVPTLAAWAKGPCPVCRREAVEALLQCGPAGRKAINQLNTRRFFSDQGVPTLVGDQIREVDSRVGVLDTYRLFTPFTLHRAQRALRVFARDQRTEIFVETLARPLPNEVELANRAKLLGTRGVYVVLAKEPRTLQIHATDSFRQDGFTRQKQEQLGKVLLPLLEKDNYDQALTLLIEQLTDVELDEEK